jgi:hypothetical protein
MEDERTRTMKAMVWGWFLIGVGALFLMDRFHVITLPNIGLLWPLAFVALAAIHVVERRYGSAIMFVLLGAWFEACTLEWHGITYHNSWPALIVVAGIGILVPALTGEEGRVRARHEVRLQRKAQRLRDRADRLERRYGGPPPEGPES